MSGSFGGLSSCSTPLGTEAGDEQRSRKYKVRPQCSFTLCCCCPQSYLLRHDKELSSLTSPKMHMSSCPMLLVTAQCSTCSFCEAHHDCQTGNTSMLREVPERCCARGALQPRRLSGLRSCTSAL